MKWWLIRLNKLTARWESQIPNPCVQLTLKIAIDPERKQKYPQNRCLMSIFLMDKFKNSCQGRMEEKGEKWK